MQLYARFGSSNGIAVLVYIAGVNFLRRLPCHHYIVAIREIIKKHAAIVEEITHTEAGSIAIGAFRFFGVNSCSEIADAELILIAFDKLIVVSVNEFRGSHRNRIFVAGVHELLRIDTAVDSIEVISVAVIVLEREHLSEVGLRIYTVAPEERYLRIVERLRKSAINLCLGHCIRLCQIALPREQITVAVLSVRRRNNFFYTNHHLFGDRHHIDFGI